MRAAALVLGSGSGFGFPRRSNEKQQSFGVGTEAGDRLGAARRVPKAAFALPARGAALRAGGGNFDHSEKRAEQNPRERLIVDGRGLAAVFLFNAKAQRREVAKVVVWVWTLLHAALFLVWRFLL